MNNELKSIGSFVLPFMKRYNHYFHCDHHHEIVEEILEAVNKSVCHLFFLHQENAHIDDDGHHHHDDHDDVADDNDDNLKLS